MRASADRRRRAVIDAPEQGSLPKAGFPASRVPSDLFWKPLTFNLVYASSFTGYSACNNKMASYFIIQILSLSQYLMDCNLVIII